MVLPDGLSAGGVTVGLVERPAPGTFLVRVELAATWANLEGSGLP